MQELTLAKTAAWLQQCEDAYILIHRSPDGDCIGAGYALAEILQQLGKRAAVLCNDEIPPRYQFMLPEQPAAADFPPKCIIAVDVADAKLLGSRIQEQYGSRVDLCIDHHVSNVPYAKARLLDGTASAVCEILYRLCRVLPVQITDSIAVCLYTGMATDTGCFQYDNAGPETHRAVAALMEICPDVRYAWINRKMFAVKSFGRLQLDKLLIDHLECYLDGKCVLICVSQEFLKIPRGRSRTGRHCRISATGRGCRDRHHHERKRSRKIPDLHAFGRSGQCICDLSAAGRRRPCKGCRLSGRGYRR